MSYNRPELTTNATWKFNATTFATNNTVGAFPYAIFVNRNNTIVAANWRNGDILIWYNASASIPTRIDANLTAPYTLFVTSDDRILVFNEISRGRIDLWSLRTRTFISFIHVNRSCYGLFVDLNETIYCSQKDYHVVVTYSLANLSRPGSVVAGNGVNGSSSFELNDPHGIFVDTNGDLYVADCGNHRIQRFKRGELNGTTVAGTGANGTVALRRPTGIALDRHGFLFITENTNHRVVASSALGFRCIAGCPNIGNDSLLPHRLRFPYLMAFDTVGNFYVTDTYNNRIQKFDLVYNFPTDQTTSTEMMSTGRFPR